jgi:hypothetical protein
MTDDLSKIALAIEGLQIALMDSALTGHVRLAIPEYDLRLLKLRTGAVSNGAIKVNGIRLDAWPE